MRRNDRKVGDPHHIGKRGKTTAQRRGRYDSGWSPTEQRTREKLLKQFTKLEGPSGNSEAFKRGYERIDWGSE